MAKTKCAIIGSGNIGTDLMVKILRGSSELELAVEGLAMARARGVTTTHEGIDGLRALTNYPDIELVFDATSAYAHVEHAKALAADGKLVVDLTPAALGPFVVPPVNAAVSSGARNINMVTCGGQATIPIVAAVSSVTPVHYAEIVASVSSRSAGPGTRANIDEFTRTTAKGIEVVGGAAKGRAIIILNPADPPMIMRDTIFTLTDLVDESLVCDAVKAMVAEVQRYVPGYRLKQDIQFERFGSNRPLKIPGYGEFEGMKTSVFLEVEGAGDYLPKYAGNLDIMTAAAKAAAEVLVRQTGRIAA